MSYIGENVAVADFSKQTFTANSSTTVFVLSSSVANSSCLIVSVGGVIQEPDVAYTASGTTLTFSVAPTTGNDVYVIYIGKELPKTTHGDNTITNALIPDGSITSDKIQSLAPSKLTGSLPAIDGSALTGVGVNTDYLEDNIALLGFKLAANNALAKYNLVDRTIDEYQDATGIDASASTDEVAGGTGTGKYYSGDPGRTAHTIPTIGSPGHSTSVKKIGTHSITFPAEGDSISIASHSDWDLGTNDFTVEFWAYNIVATSASTDGAAILLGGTSHSAGAIAGFGYYTTGGLWLYLGSGSSWDIAQQKSMGALPGASWVHYAVTRNGTTFRTFRNGIQQATFTSSGSIETGSGGGVQICDHWFAGATGLTGNMDEIRISNISRYDAAFTPATTAFTTDANTKLLIHGDGNFTDSSGIAAATGMSLVSTSTTASTAPTKGDMTVLIEDNLGTATINTDIKGYVSRNGGTGWDQGTLVHEGTWGTNRKVLSFHDQTFSNSASGTDMRYKIETANQSYAETETSSVKSYTGANQTFTVPAGVTSITFTAWGGAGAGGISAVGGGGGYITGNVVVVPGEELNVKVGGGGTHNGGGVSVSGGGGGGTGIYRNTAVLAIAGGGGGSAYNLAGGFGGGTTGGNGVTSGNTAGNGGTQSAGGTAASQNGITPISGGDAGSLNQGGHACNGSPSGAEAWPSNLSAAYNGGGKGGGDHATYMAGGGGGGYYGGSGGGVGPGSMSGGQNGSGAGGSSLTAGTNTQSSGVTPGGTGHANYVAGVGVGGAAGAHGGNGHAVITYTAISGKQTRIHATSLAWS